MKYRTSIEVEVWDILGGREGLHGEKNRQTQGGQGKREPCTASKSLPTPKAPRASQDTPEDTRHREGGSQMPSQPRRNGTLRTQLHKPGRVIRRILFGIHIQVDDTFIRYYLPNTCSLQYFIELKTATTPVMPSKPGFWQWRLFLTSSLIHTPLI